jgi:hypothetical protein
MAKKAAFQMSLGFIVAIVLSVTLLILSISWLNSMFSSITDITDKVTTQAHEELAKNLQSGKAKVGMTIPDKVKQDRSKEGKFEVGIKNQDYDDQCFILRISLAAVDEGVKAAECGAGAGAGCITQLQSEVNKWFTYFPPQWIEAQNVNYKVVSTRIDPQTLPGSYLFKINVYKNKGISDPEQCTEDASLNADYYDDIELIIQVT